MCSVFSTTLIFFYTFAENNCSSFDSFVRWIFGIVLCARACRTLIQIHSTWTAVPFIWYAVDLKIHCVPYSTNSTYAHTHIHALTMHEHEKKCKKKYQQNFKISNRRIGVHESKSIGIFLMFWTNGWKRIDFNSNLAILANVSLCHSVADCVWVYRVLYCAVCLRIPFNVYYFSTMRFLLDSNKVHVCVIRYDCDRSKAIYLKAEGNFIHRVRDGSGDAVKQFLN